ncbi:hypothetical protein [Bartonella sp. CM120XJJH]|uniref:hypothetical protein n=1 Tax=Bartonella sp. CM120XJJH TaxID=3243544 RepID=UPI0035D0ED22
MEKSVMMPIMLFHKRKNGGVQQWIYHYSIHRCRREMGLRALRNISLKQVCELAMQIYFV